MDVAGMSGTWSGMRIDTLPSVDPYSIRIKHLCRGSAEAEYNSGMADSGIDESIEVPITPKINRWE